MTPKSGHRFPEKIMRNRALSAQYDSG